MRRRRCETKICGTQEMEDLRNGGFMANSCRVHQTLVLCLKRLILNKLINIKVDLHGHAFKSVR